MNKSILVLGANGFIGNALIKQLCQDSKLDIYGIDLEKDNLEHSLDKTNFHFIEGDINIRHDWIEHHIKKCDIIIPLVAIATPNVYVKNPLKIFQLDFESNLKVIKWAVEYKKRIIFPSTSEVYGMCSDEKFNEYTSSLVVGPVHKSRWIYSTSKQLLDRIIFAYGEKDGLAFTLFRPFNWVGPKLDSLKKAQLGNGRVLTIFIYNLLNNIDLTIVGDGTQTRSFTYIDDGISALIKIIQNKKDDLNGKIFNIGNPENNISIEELAKLVVVEFNKIHSKKYTGKIIKKTQLEFYGKGYEDIPMRVPDISEAKNLLQWYPSYNLKNSIQKTLEAFINYEDNKK